MDVTNFTESANADRTNKDGIFAAVMVCLSIFALGVIVAWFQCKIPLSCRRRLTGSSATDTEVLAVLDSSDEDDSVDA